MENFNFFASHIHHKGALKHSVFFSIPDWIKKKKNQVPYDAYLFVQ